MTPYEKEQLEKIRQLEIEIIEKAEQFAKTKGLVSEVSNKVIKWKMTEMKTLTNNFLKFTKIKTTLHEVNKPALSENINTLNGYLR
jgi:hypothetical protein